MRVSRGAWRAWLVVSGTMLLASGCSSDGAPDGGAADGEIVVEIGRPDPADDLAFLEFESGGDLPLETFGQGGTHVRFAVRATGLGSNKGFLDVTMLNLTTGDRVANPPMSRPDLWYCAEGSDTCEQSRLFVMTGGLAKPAEKDGLRVRVIAEVTALDGRRGEAATEGVLRAPPGGIRENDGFVGDADAGADDAGF
jgi:hypothetical protein